MQLYRDPKDRYKKGQTKASLSLQHFLGFESGFTLDKESNTIAIICQDVTVVLAFETRERLIAWQVKVGGQLGSSKEFLVMIGAGGSRKLPAGPARLHLQGRRFALTSGVPPRLLGLWEIAHLRRYGVAEGRFCFEGGSYCGKGEGVHLLITDQAQDITDAFDRAAQGNLPLQRSPASRTDAERSNKSRPNTRLSDQNNGDQSMPDSACGLYEENFFGEDCGEHSRFWPSDERQDHLDHEYRAETEIDAEPPWTGADHVTLERCNNCLSKLGVMTRTSTVAISPNSHQFNPAWTMESVPESSSDNSSNSTEYLTPKTIRKNLESCKCHDRPPQRPPKPPHLDQKKPPAPLPFQSCSCVANDNYTINNIKVGPYENYDVPKTAHTEIDNAQYYDTPKRLKKALAEELFQITDKPSPGTLVLKKKCGCILKFGSNKKPLIVECNENLQPAECPCIKVTNWANNLISLPYCKRSSSNERVNTEIAGSNKSEEMAIYATIDVSRKTNRQSAATDKETTQNSSNDAELINYQNMEPKEDKRFEGPYANYENLEFALSLEFYENAKDLLKKAGVTQSELDALSANIDIAVTSQPKKSRSCTKCAHTSHNLPQEKQIQKNKIDEYLLMEPAKEVKVELPREMNPGYTPMSPNPNWSQSLKHPIHKLHNVEIEKSISIPILSVSANTSHNVENKLISNNREAMQKRSASVDSARLLEDLKEFDSSIGSHATSSSLETLRNMAIEGRLSPCDNERECYDCCKSSGSENKTSEESSCKEIPHLRNKHMDNAQIKRSSSVPCKSGGNRDSSSSNDSGVSSCSLKHGGGEFQEFEMPMTSMNSRYHYMVHKKMRGNLTSCLHSSLPRKSKSSDLLRDVSMQLHKASVPAKSSSAEAEVPVLPPKQFKGVMDTHSTSSGTSDMSDYIETLSLTSSHSSSDTPTGMRLNRQPMSTLRPRSGKEYHNRDPILTSMFKNGKDLTNYSNIP
ncbi:unnamed protein product [Parnassius mnemosyne]|uniref:IRS-type PTB domain-containing protein n=1 Tax=Parnassius mnemosyne TaxID=213953 RepID=A0AAV1KZU5_9NEOP